MNALLSADTPIQELVISNELLAFAKQHGFNTMAAMLAPGLKELHQLTSFNYRLQREVVHLVVVNKWDDLMLKD